MPWKKFQLMSHQDSQPTTPMIWRIKVLNLKQQRVLMCLLNLDDESYS